MNTEDKLQNLLGVAILGALCYAAAGSARADEPTARDVAETINSNFSHVVQSDAYDRLRFHTGEEPFSGDCDDHAMATYYQFWKRGGDPELVLVKAKDGTLHVLTCDDGWCVDSARLEVLGADPVYPESELPRLYLRIMDRGYVSPGYIAENFN